MDYRKLLREGLTKASIKITDEIRAEVLKFSTDEQLLRSGGISIEALDRAAHGFSEDDVKVINPSKLKVRWRNDLEGVKWEVESSGLTPEQWSSKVDLSEPIDVDYWEGDGWPRALYIQDGHHRYYAASTLGKMLNVNLQIKINPITELAPDLGYDDFHREVFKLVHSQKD